MKILVRDNDSYDFIYGVLTIDNKAIKKTDVQKKVHEFFNSPIAYGYTQEKMKEECLTMDDLECYDYTIDDIINFFPDEWEFGFDNFEDEILI